MADASHVLWIRLRSRTGERLAPAALRKRLVADAKEAGTNINDVAVSILAAKYRVAFSPSGRSTTPARSADVLNLRVPPALWRALGAHEGSRQRTAIADLSEHYGLSK